MKAVGAAIGVMLLTVRCEAQPPPTVPYPKPHPISGEHGWRSGIFRRPDAPYMQRRLRQAVAITLAAAAMACAAPQPPPIPQPAYDSPRHGWDLPNPEQQTQT